MRVIVLTAAALAFAVPVAAKTYRAINWLPVILLTNDTFEVIEDRGAGPRGIWCAAADYTRAIGRDTTRKRLYILEARGPSKRVKGAKSVVFTLEPDEELARSPQSYSLSVRRVGDNLAVSHALNFCDLPVDEFLDRF